MQSQDGRFIFLYNGEIYNYLELREELVGCGVQFRTHGDTEVLMHSLIHWRQDALCRLNGMWAFVLLDLVSGEIMLSRDRFGIKPLYIYSDEQAMYISSEIKAILQVTGKRFRVTGSTANAYLNQNLLNVNSTTFFEGIEEFPPAHWAIMRVEEIGKKHIEARRYWSIATTVTEDVNERELIEAVRATLSPRMNGVDGRSDLRAHMLPTRAQTPIGQHGQAR